MKLRRPRTHRFANLRNCEIIFKKPDLLNAVIGSNTNGKTNLV